MSKLTVLSGLPGSGKSTEARKIFSALSNWDKQHTEILSWDEERKRIPDPTDAEVTAQLISHASDCLRNHSDVIIDACNLHPCDYVRWETLAFALGAGFAWIEMKTHPRTCITQDSLRPEPVGAERITELLREHLIQKDACPRINLTGTPCQGHVHGACITCTRIACPHIGE